MPLIINDLQYWLKLDTVWNCCVNDKVVFLEFQVCWCVDCARKILLMFWNSLYIFWNENTHALGCKPASQQISVNVRENWGKMFCKCHWSIDWCVKCATVCLCHVLRRLYWIPRITVYCVLHSGDRCRQCSIIFTNQLKIV